MSRAFVKEDVEITERTTRRRSVSGLPPGALNYLTASGAARLRARLAELQGARKKDGAEIARLERALASATIVDPQPQPDAVTFGVAVTLQLEDGRLETYRIVGADEVELVPGNVSWVSPIGKALLGAELGQQVTFADDKTIRTVLKID